MNMMRLMLSLNWYHKKIKNSDASTYLSFPTSLLTIGNVSEHDEVKVIS